MADGVKVAVNGADKVMSKLKSMVALTENFMPLFNKLLGDPFDPPSWSLRGGVKYNFDNETGPNNETWPALSESYAKWKLKNFGARPRLFLHGILYESLVYVNDQTVIQMTGKKLTWGTAVPYAAVHQTGQSPRWIGEYPRPYMGLRSGQKQRLQLEIRKYMVAAYNAANGSTT